MKQFRVLFAASAVALGMWSMNHTGVHAAGAGAVSYTQHDQNVTDVTSDFNPCTYAPGTLTQTYNDVFHVTTLANGTDWFTFTEEGSFSFVPTDSSQPSYTGHFTVWGGQNDNLKNGNSTFTLSVHGTGSDGSQLTFHETEHFSVSATGVVVTFDNVRCG